MRKTVATTTEFLHTWDSRVNFLMAGECVPFSFEFPSTEDIVERLVAEEATTGISGQLRNTGDRENAMESFRGMSCDDLMASSFQFRYPDVTTLDRPGDIFAGFTEQVLVPWKLYLLDHGFTWDRCYAHWPGSPAPIPVPATTWIARTCCFGMCAAAKSFTVTTSPTAGCRLRGPTTGGRRRLCRKT